MHHSSRGANQGARSCRVPSLGELLFNFQFVKFCNISLGEWQRYCGNPRTHLSHRPRESGRSSWGFPSCLGRPDSKYDRYCVRGPSKESDSQFSFIIVIFVINKLMFSPILLKFKPTVNAPWRYVSTCKPVALCVTEEINPHRFFHQYGNCPHGSYIIYNHFSSGKKWCDLSNLGVLC